MARKPFIPIPPMAELPTAEEINVQEILGKYLSGTIDLICVLGPTASGKTRYAVQLARQINKILAEHPRGESSESMHPSRAETENNIKGTCGAEIISADSRQVYRGMDIGTGKDLSEYEEIPYHLMDIVDAGTKYNIFEYQRDFEKAYKDIVERGGIPILCGGSGLYIEAATCGYSLPEVPTFKDMFKLTMTNGACWGRVYIDDNGALTLGMSPMNIVFSGDMISKTGTITFKISNTPGNEVFRKKSYFDSLPPEEVGPYRKLQFEFEKSSVKLQIGKLILQKIR
jgi:hypothetical protein